MAFEEGGRQELVWIIVFILCLQIFLGIKSAFPVSAVLYAAIFKLRSNSIMQGAQVRCTFHITCSQP